MEKIRPDEGLLYTNTSLSRTAKARLVESGIPAEVATKKTGRISAKADQIETDQIETFHTSKLQTLRSR